MQIYLDVVILLNFLVDFLLLMGADRLCGSTLRLKRAIPAAALGGAYGGVCLLPDFLFLGSLLWRIVCLALMAAIAFGISLGALRRGMVFLLLSMALGGIALGLGNGGFWSLTASAAGVFLLCAIGFRGRLDPQVFVPVELTYGEKHLHLTALQDTGNTLCDPVTGNPVLVVGAEIGEKLLGLSPQQMKDPVSSVKAVPGLRLIPYHTVGQSGTMLLAIRLPTVRIGTYQGSYLVAFAPEKLDREGVYQALTGGTV